MGPKQILTTKRMLKNVLLCVANTRILIYYYHTLKQIKQQTFLPSISSKLTTS